MTLLKINRLLPIYICIVPLKFKVDIQSQRKVRVRKPKNPIWPPGGHFESDVAEKSIGFCLWPPSTCIWNLKLKFKRKLDLCSGNHVVYRQTDGRTDRRTDKVNPVYPPPTSLGGGIITCSLWVAEGNDLEKPKPQTMSGISRSFIREPITYLIFAPVVRKCATDHVRHNQGRYLLRHREVSGALWSCKFDRHLGSNTPCQLSERYDGLIFNLVI